MKKEKSDATVLEKNGNKIQKGMELPDRPGNPEPYQEVSKKEVPDRPPRTD